MVRVKKTTSLSLMLSVLVFFAACGGDELEEPQVKALSNEDMIPTTTLPAASTDDAEEVAGATAVATEAAEESAGALLYKTKTCATCHGNDGLTPILPSYPVIARQSEPYALQQMLDIKNGVRTNAQSIAMKGITHLVTDEELAVLAAYIANELGPEPSGAGSTDQNSEGATLFKTKTCFTCHGADGKSPILPDYPKIAGHGAEYSLQQMKDIKSGARANGMSMAMKGIMHLVSEEEMVLLAEYIATLKR